MVAYCQQIGFVDQSIVKITQGTKEEVARTSGSTVIYSRIQPRFGEKEGKWRRRGKLGVRDGALRSEIYRRWRPIWTHSKSYLWRKQCSSTTTLLPKFLSPPNKPALLRFIYSINLILMTCLYLTSWVLFWDGELFCLVCWFCFLDVILRVWSVGKGNLLMP